MIRTSDPGYWAELFNAFDTLVVLDAGERAARLAVIGESDPDGRRVLEDLLEADSSSPSSLSDIDGIFGAEPPGSDRSANRDVLMLVGKTVAHFRIIEPLAAGGMGVVYRAIDTRLRRPVAIKFPLPGQHVDGQVRERFLREARAASALDHPNICGIYEAGETETGQLFFAMPLYEGETLKARIARVGPLPIADALGIALQIARALTAAHRAGIVHRDLKPANVIILGDGGVKILDFGVARVGDATLTRSHGALGTVFYMAPEQFRGKQLDGRADLWALGVLLYEMLTGRRPFDGEHEIAVVHAIVDSNPVRPSALRPEIWPELDALVLELLAKQPDRRPTRADTVATELAALGSKSPPPLTVHRWRPTYSTFPSRRRLVWAATSALVIAGVVITAWRLQVRSASGATEPRIVAVLPFEDSSASADTGYLAVALADEIARRLSGLRAVAVSGEWAAVEYRGSAKPAADIASEIGADAIVRVSARRAGDEVLLQIDLFDMTQNQRVWTREYRGPVSDALALQRNATDGVASALNLQVTRTERAALTRVPTASPEAYNLYLRGRAAQMRAAPGNLSRPKTLSQSQLENLHRAQSYYARARDADPGFAAARARLALLHLALRQEDGLIARRDQARIEAEAALRLQPGISEAHEALALYWLSRDEPLQMNSELGWALAGRPNASHLHFLLGNNLRQVGRWEEAVSELERASRLDPRNKRIHATAAVTYSRMRRYDEGIAHWDRVIAIDSARDPYPQIIRGQAYLRRGNVDSLEAGVSRVPLGLDPGGMVTYTHYTVHHIRRRHAEALACLDSARFAVSADSLLYRPVALLRAQTLELMGEPAAARSAYQVAKAFLEDSVKAHPKEARLHVALGLAYAGLHRRMDAMREARTATELVPLSIDSPNATAFIGGAIEVYAQLSEADSAFELIELLLSMPAGREISIPLLRLDPAFDNLRSDPRFEAVIARFSKT
ncbi:MAG TPA: protein kinase [Gemmatimonadaceae bacterium]|nr:protein kinase [Gemmatimonadaceae bacterium]